MGYVNHHAIVVTSWDDKKLDRVHATAVAFGMCVTAVVKSEANGYSSFMVAPDGSKEGWGASCVGDAQRESLMASLDSFRYEDGSTSLEWCEVAYGSDDRTAMIVRHAWTGIEEAEEQTTTPTEGAGQ